MSEIRVIGVDARGISEAARRLLADCPLVVASARLARHLADCDAEVIPVTPLPEAFARMEAGLAHGPVGVLASGDPLLFGIGSRLIDHFGRERVRILPAVSSLQEAFAAFALPWGDAAIVSLHGRSRTNIAAELLRARKTFVFTDRHHPPGVLAERVLAYLELIGAAAVSTGCRLYVAERLGEEGERLSEGTLAEMACRRFADLNVACLVLPELPERPPFGLHEEEIAHSRGLITKDEVRAATLHRLRLPHRGVFWDIGGGSGSVSLEAAALLPHLDVYTVERREEELANIRENIRRFALFNITPVAAEAPAGLEALPDPDAVFVGGSGGNLAAIIATAATRLTLGGRLVVNGVSDQTVAEAPQHMRGCGLEVTASTVEVSRTGPSGSLRFNPITIMVGQK